MLKVPRLSAKTRVWPFAHQVDNCDQKLINLLPKNIENSMVSGTLGRQVGPGMAIPGAFGRQVGSGTVVWRALGRQVGPGWVRGQVRSGFWGRF